MNALTVSDMYEHYCSLSALTLLVGW